MYFLPSFAIKVNSNGVGLFLDSKSNLNGVIGNLSVICTLFEFLIIINATVIALKRLLFPEAFAP